MVWARIIAAEGQVFTQIRGRIFIYEIISGSIVPSTTNRRLPMTDFKKAFSLVPLKNTAQIKNLQGPSYIYAIMMDSRIRADDW